MSGLQKYSNPKQLISISIQIVLGHASRYSNNCFQFQRSPITYASPAPMQDWHIQQQGSSFTPQLTSQDQIYQVSKVIILPAVVFSLVRFIYEFCVRILLKICI